MHPYAKVFNLYVRTRDSPVDDSKVLSGKVIHLKSIAKGLRDIQSDVTYSMNALQYFFSGDKHCYYQESVSNKLTTSAIRFEGLLDALVICALPEGTLPSTKMNFRVQDFENPRLSTIQDRIKNLKSYSETNHRSYADLWTLAEFWKRCLPCPPVPTEFPNRRVDFQIELGLGKSGPILRDLIVPAFNYACDMVSILGQEFGMDKDDYVVEKVQIFLFGFFTGVTEHS